MVAEIPKKYSQSQARRLTKTQLDAPWYTLAFAMNVGLFPHKRYLK